MRSRLYFWLLDERVPACGRTGSSPKLSDKKLPFIDPVN